MLLRVAVAALLLALLPSIACAEKRVALVIGNGAYAKVGRLPNPARDADAVEALFRAAGFDVIEARRDLGAASMRRALRDFSDQVRNSDIAVVFYAGHGIEVNGTNYLIPVDAALERDIDVEDETVPLERVTQILEQAKRLRLVILDACRDNPFLRSMKRTVTGRSIGRGLAKIDVLTSDTLIAFAAKAGSTAADGEGANSPYTTALVKHLTTPGLDLRLVLGRVRDDVLKSTANRQEPFVYGSLGGAEISLVPAAKPQPQAAPQPQAPHSLSEAAEAWGATKDSNSIVVLEAFIARYKNTFYAELARARMEELKKQHVSVAAPLTPAMPTVSATPPAEPRPATLLRSAAHVLERVMPAVASIQVKTPTTSANPAPKVPQGSPFEEFFEDFFKNRNSSPKEEIAQEASGFIISADGLLVTSLAAIESAQEIVVTINGAKYKAKSVGHHAGTNLVLLKIDSGQKFPFVAFSKRNVVLGEQVLKVGSPFGLHGSASMAKVSGWQKVGELPECIELNALVNKGETGAPIFNSDGEVVGVGHSSRSDGKGTGAAGYAVPANVATYVIDQLRRTGAVADPTALSKEISKARELSSLTASRFDTEVPLQLVNNVRGGVVFIDNHVGTGAERKLGRGSGFVIDGKEGIVITNNHVIDGADEIIINFHDGSKLKVEKVIGKDTKTDLAVLKVTPKKPLSSVRFGSSTKMKVGDWVMAIGNPFALGGSVTVGIISGKERDINSGPYDNYLQTDAAMNRGDTGGPLFNKDGEVVGMNTVIFSGIGFVMPSDAAVFVIDQLRQYGEMRRGYVGVNVQSISDEIAKTLSVKENTGALVASVTPQSPAAKAGIQDGDVILKFDGKDVTSMRGLPRLVAQTPVGKDVDVELLRKGQRTNLKVAVGRLAEEDEPVKTAAKDAPKGKGKGKGKGKDPDKAAPPVASRSSLIGLVLAPLNDEQRTKHSIGKDMKGVIVLEVDPASPAAEKGVKVGDVIVEVASEAVTSLDDITKSVDKVKKAGRKAVLLFLEDGKGNPRFVALPIQ